MSQADYQLISTRASDPNCNHGIVSCSDDDLDVDVKTGKFLEGGQAKSNGMAGLGTSKSVTRKWEIFPGRNIFLCDGRLMTAPHTGVFYLTIFLITIASALFFIYDCPFLTWRISPLIPIIGVALFFFTMSALLRTAFTDPGIIPRATPDEASYIEKQIEVPNSANSPTYRPPPRTKEVVVKGQTVKLKYCFTCKIFRPPRASHCSICDNCVERFDHHCPWVGNCVGKRNYRFFYMFVVSLAFLAVFIFACAVTHLILLTSDGEKLFLEAVKESPASVIVTVICFFSVWSVLGLAGFHTYLITSNLTTNEDIKGSFTAKRGQDRFNPYSQGNVCLNCFYVLCGPSQPSLIDRRGVVTAEYRAECIQPVIIANSNIPAPNKTFETIKGISQISAERQQQIPVMSQGIYSYTNEMANGSNTSVNYLVSNELPLTVIRSINSETQPSSKYKTSPLYSNLPSASFTASTSASNTTTNQQSETKFSSTDDKNHHPVLTTRKSYLKSSETNQKSDEPSRTYSQEEINSIVGDLDLDPVVIRDNCIVSVSETKPDVYDRRDGDLTGPEKENNMLSASRLRLLQDTTMIESALDLDSLDDSSIGNNSQAGLLKVGIV